MFSAESIIAALKENKELSCEGIDSFLKRLIDRKLIDISLLKSA